MKTITITYSSIYDTTLGAYLYTHKIGEIAQIAAKVQLVNEITKEYLNGSLSAVKALEIIKKITN